MPSTLTLPAELTIYTLGELYPQWLASLGAQAGVDADADADTDADTDAPFWVDAAAVDEVDAAGVQLLASLANALTRRQRRLQLVDPSPALVKACRTLGLAALLVQPAAEAAA